MNYSSRQLCANIFFRGTRIDQFFANIFFRGTRIKNKNVIHIANVYVLERIRTRGRGGGGGASLFLSRPCNIPICLCGNFFRLYFM